MPYSGHLVGGMQTAPHGPKTLDCGVLWGTRALLTPSSLIHSSTTSSETAGALSGPASFWRSHSGLRVPCHQVQGQHPSRLVWSHVALTAVPVGLF